MRQHAYFIAATVEEGIESALAIIENELGMKLQGNPDVVVLRHGLFSVEDARSVAEAAASAPMVGREKAVVIAASRAYHEAQNALLKIFEEPAPGLHLFFILPSTGMLLPTLRSRVQVVRAKEKGANAIPAEAQEFLAASREKRSTIAKKLATGDDEEERRLHRDEALAIVNGVEAAAFAKFKKERGREAAALLSDIAIVRTYLYDRSAPVRMILEHLAIVIPKGLGK
ncbi:hypothetical protein HY091_01355 [Candidatus Kaiserbacteria bacterium]|nr:hypothetical protein [Candidatus Kaiserbacteria bacterium]